MKATESTPFDLPGPPPADQLEDAKPASPDGLDLRAFEITLDDLAVIPAPENLEAPGLEAPQTDSAVDLAIPPEDNLPRTRYVSHEPTPAMSTAAPATVRPETLTKSWLVYAGAGAVSVAWALAPIMFAVAYRRDVAPFQNDVFAFMVLGFMALGPIALVWIAAFVLNQGLRLAAESRRAQALADTMIQPAALAAREVGGVVEHVRLEIEHATAAAGDARAELLNLREIIAAESERLVEAAQNSSRTANALTLGLGAERERMTELAGSLDAQATGVVDAINRHARMVAEASDLAETQIREAEASLAARAADLAAAAGEATDAARIAGDDLSRQVARLETAGLGVGDQVRIVEEGLTEQRAALITAAHGMRADHEAFAAEAESHLAQLNEVMIQARSGAGEMSDKAAEHAEALRQLIDSATQQLREMAQGASQERDLFSAQAAQSLGALSQAALAEREVMERRARETVEQLAAAAEQAGRATAEQAEQTRRKVDLLSEAAFAAGQRADQVFEARLNDARSMIEQSAQLVADAGERSTQKLGEGLEAARTTLSELQALLADVDLRASTLPAEAQARADAVRQSIERGMEELMASARKASEETQSIDAAFQDRVRRNYDMLSEAVRLMGVVAGSASTAGARTPAQPRTPPPERAAPPPSPRSDDSPLGQRLAATLRPEPEQPAAPRWSDPQSAADAAGLRPRLRLTPTASDEEFKTVFEAAGGREPTAEGGEDSWTWKELLSSMDEPAEDDGTVALALLNAIEAMGIDAGALLPRSRIDQIAQALRNDDPEGGRPIVRRLAPAAVRRLSRRMMSDRAFRGQTERFVKRYADMINEAITGGGGGVGVSALLASDQGRAFLLIDAAAGELA